MIRLKNFPHIKLKSKSFRGNYYSAYASDNENAELGYVLFISHTEGVNDYCECMAYVHGNPCYHLVRAKELEVVLQL